MRAKGKILVASREKAVLHMAKTILEDEGYEVFVARKSSDVFKTLKKHICDVFLTDLTEPPKDTDGLELVQNVLKYDPNINTVVATDCIETARSTLHSGANAYILKPFDTQEFKTVIKNTFEKKHLKEENRHLKELFDVYRITNDAITGNDMDASLLKYILYCATVQTGSKFGSIMLMNEDSGRLKNHVSIGTAGSKWASFNVERGIRNFLNIKETSGRDFNESCKLTKGDNKAELWVGNISIPLKIRDKTLGVLNVCRDSGVYYHADLQILRIVADQVSVYLENCTLINNLKEAFFKTIESLSLALEAKDPYTHGHSRRVGNLCLKIGQLMGLSEKMLYILRQGGYIHDIGKIGLKDNVLNKPGKLTPEELEYAWTHSNMGDDILKPLDSMNDLRKLVRHHHERFDGLGYPDHLKGSDLTTEIRIISLADAFDAMDSDRPYRCALSREKIEKELLENSGSQFAPEVVDAMFTIMRDGDVFQQTDA